MKIKILLKKLKEFIDKRTPAQLIVISYAILILIGTVILKLPFSHIKAHISFIDALFTSTSAICVTGLTVLDTAKDLSKVGQIVILCLIQIGGIGIMTISSFLLLAVGKKISIKSRRALRESFDQISSLKLRSLIASIILFTFLMETIGSLFLYMSWKNQLNSNNAWFVSIFHSISAFCNAGFSLFSDSLMKYYNNGYINLIICILIITGGLGFFVVNELFIKLFRKKFTFKLLTLHTKIVITTTFILIISGAIALLFFEYNNTSTIEHFSLKGKIYSVIFQSITSRTAGFNTIAIDKLSGCSLVILILLMFIGGSPGSTAGGIKTTTAAILYSIARAKISGIAKLFAFSRTFPMELIEKAVTITVVAVILISTGAILIFYSEYPYVPVNDTESFFIKSLFEATSAFGTVGLSTGITSSLNNFSKIILIILMYIGRLGPLTLALALTERELKSRIEYAEESVMIG